MKILITLLAGLVITAQASERFHTFSTNDGQHFEGLLLSNNPEEMEAELLLQDGTSVTINDAELSEEDRMYIEQKEMCRLFMSASEFLIIPTRVVDRKKLLVDRSDTTGRKIADTTDQSTHTFHLSICNLGNVAVENIFVEYQICYSHTRPSAEGLSLQPENSTTTLKGNVDVSHAVSGSFPLSKVAPGENGTFCTGEVTLHDQFDSASISSMRISLYLENPEGELLQRYVNLSNGNKTQSALYQDVMH